MTIARKTFQTAFWETDDTSGRPALQIEHQSLEEAQIDISGPRRSALPVERSRTGLARS